MKTTTTRCALTMSYILLASFVISMIILAVLAPTFPSEFRSVFFHLTTALAPHLGLTIAAVFATRGEEPPAAESDRLRCMYSVLIITCYSVLFTLLIVLFAANWLKVPMLLDLMRICATGLGLPTSAVVTYYFLTAHRS